MARVKLTIEIDEDIHKAFKAKLEDENCRQPQVVQAAMNSFAEGLLVLQGKFLAPLNAPRESNPVGRPRTKPLPEKEELTKEPEKPIWESKMVGQIHPACDDRPSLKATTRGEVSKCTFENFLLPEFIGVRWQWPYRSWYALKHEEFISCAAMKFMTVNKLHDAIRFDLEPLIEELAACPMTLEQWFEQTPTHLVKEPIHD